MRTKRRNAARLTALGGVALAVAAGCAMPGHAPRRPTPGDAVSVGYGTQSRKDITGSITSVSRERVAHGSISHVRDLLEGIPGLQVFPLAGGEITVRIRGTGTGPGSAEPLLVIDDAPVPTGRIGSVLASVPPRDIVRIDVLKDVASTAVYGMRGANGVVIVTTRRRR